MIFRLLFLFLTLFQGCTTTSEKSFFKEVDKNLFRGEYFYETNEEESSILIFKLDPGSFNFEVLHREAQLLAEWSSDAEGIFLNGGFFDPEGKPTGFLVSDGKKIGKNIYDKDKSGTLIIEENKIKIAEEFNENESFLHALQNFPLLIKNGKNNIKKDSGKVARRTAVGTDQDGFFYIIISNQGDLSLFAFAEVITKLPIDFNMVLNLDGGSSTGIYVNLKKFKDRIFSFVPIPNILKITPKK